ncbi:MAG: hypothetical protein JJU09_05335 [Rhodobacteraceae bacterium]|nr:hypothetical protein [Paracoccaceae bacterium]
MPPSNLPHSLDMTALELEARRMRAEWIADGLKTLIARLSALIPHGGASARG